MSDKGSVKFDWPIVGHENISKYLQKSISKDKLTHAYLFSGLKGLGKSTLVRYFISSLLCENDKIKPCQTCPKCEDFFKGIYPDFFSVEKEQDKKNIGIEQIRELKDKLSLGSFLNSYKVALIEDSEYLSQEAGNSLLKTLEEPAGNTIIVLITKDSSLLPETIVSRCQIINFSLVSNGDIYDHLVSLGAKRNLAKDLSNLSGGRPARAIDFFQSEDLLGEYRDGVLQLIKISQGSILEKFKAVDSFIPFTAGSIESVGHLNGVLEVWLSVLRDSILYKNSLPGIMNNIFVQKQIKEFSDRYSILEIKDLIDKIKSTKQYLYKNINPRLAMENLVLNF